MKTALCLFQVLTITMLWSVFFTLNVWSQNTSRQLVQPDNGGERFALVVGNNSYPSAPLKNPVNDATGMAAALRNNGFQVTQALNVSLRDLEKAIDRFAAALRPGSVALFFYAGHGIQIEGENYLIPTDFVLKDEADAKYAAYSASRLMERMEKAGTRLNIVILDACRNNPFQTTRSASRGLAIMDSGQGTFIAFATAPGRTAEDNPKGTNGLFTTHLLETLRESGLSLDQVFSRTRERVAQASSRKQVPWTASSVIGDFYFLPDGNKSAPVTTAPAPVSETSARKAVSPYAGTIAGAKELLREFLKSGADLMTLSDQLRPTTEDYLAVFEPEFAQKAEATYSKAWDEGQMVLAPKEGQTALLLYSATSEDLKKWDEATAYKFPGGYKDVAAKFNAGITVYGFKFVKPGENLGMAFDGLVYVNGQWRIFPKPWRIAR